MRWGIAGNIVVAWFLTIPAAASSPPRSTGRCRAFSRGSEKTRPMPRAALPPPTSPSQCCSRCPARPPGRSRATEPARWRPGQSRSSTTSSRPSNRATFAPPATYSTPSRLARRPEHPLARRLQDLAGRAGGRRSPRARDPRRRVRPLLDRATAAPRLPDQGPSRRSVRGRRIAFAGARRLTGTGRLGARSVPGYRSSRGQD